MKSQETHYSRMVTVGKTACGLPVSSPSGGPLCCYEPRVLLRAKNPCKLCLRALDLPLTRFGRMLRRI